MARFCRKRRRFNAGLECYTPTEANLINSKASAAVREHRNTTICPFGLEPGMDVCSARARFRAEIEAGAFDVQ
jgi:hypothetical protein